VNRTLALLLAVGVFGAAAFGASRTALAGGSTSTHRTAGRITVSGRCPGHPLALPGDAVARAADQARIEAPAIYGDLGLGARIVTSGLARASGVRGRQVVRQCGRSVAARTVVVDLRLPKGLPSASLSQGTVFVSRFPAGYRVWEVAH
jgi:hypothetical protein